jgi:hypothetical protein
VLGVGLEPTFLAEPDPKSGASANFATRAVLSIKGLGGFDYLLFVFVLQIFYTFSLPKIRPRASRGNVIGAKLQHAITLLFGKAWGKHKMPISES